MAGIIYLDPTGNRIKSEAISNLQTAMNDIQQCINSLQETKGIGAEFCIEKLEDLRDSVNSMKAAFNKL